MTLAKHFKTLISFLILGLSLAACTRPADNMTVSGLQIKIPSASEYFSHGNHQQFVGDVDRYNRMCFAVQVTGQGITNSNGPMCSWAIAKTAGYVASGGVLVVDEVPRNVNLLFEIYGYLRASASDPCGPIPAVISQAELERTYFLGRSSKEIVSQSEGVEITLTIPAENEHLGTKISLASSCPAKGVSPIGGGPSTSANYMLIKSKFGAGGEVSSGATFKTMGKVVGTSGTPTSTHYRIK